VRFSARQLVPVALTVVLASVVLVSVATPATTPNTGGTAASAKTYVVMYKGNDVPATAAASLAKAGGKLVAGYDEIGVAVAESAASGFAAEVARDVRVEGVAASTQPVAKVGPLETESHAPESELPNAPAGQDTLAALQWDMRQIKAPQANAITGGSPAVVVADLDTGLDKDHEDLVQNIDFSRSASCESGIPNQSPAAWDDHNGHGTHTAGTIAAAANGFGITGVAPNVKLAGIKTSNDDGYFFVHMVVCAFMWAGGAEIDNPATPGVDFPATVGPRADVTNNSYFMDPYLYNCRNDPAQRLLWKAAQRAIGYAHKQGVTNVASEGNQQDDLSHPTFDDISPDFPPGSEEEREITNACLVVPVEVNGVIGVTAVGNTRQTDGDDDPNDYLKSYYSSYGVSTADVAAPGGDFFYGRGTEGQPFGLVLSTWPTEIGCGRSVTEDPPPPGGTNRYCYLQGTSMASPHAAGVAALIISRYGDLDNPQNGKMRPGTVEAYMQGTADPQPCPTALPLQGAPGSSRANVPYSNSRRPDGSLQECQGGTGHNSWYGAGQINALRAVSHDTGG
jgi:lantibiotic leader peptide-processing serine protease